MRTVELPIWAVATAGALLAAVIVVQLLLWRSRRRQLRRLSSAVLRLEERPQMDRRSGFDTLLTLLESGIDRAILDHGDASLRAERLTQALDAVPQGVVVCNDTGEVTWRNQVAREFADGRHADAVLERAVRSMLTDALGGDTHRRTLELYGPPRRVLELCAQPLASGFRTGGAIVVVEDVSEHRRVEAMRRDFVANISHELKTPIGAVALLAETLGGEDDPGVVKRLADRMQEEAQRVARIIDDLLGLSRIEAEEAPTRESVAVGLMVAEAVERVRGLADQRGIGIEVQEPPADLRLVCDRRQVVSAVFNLLENAVKYSGEGGVVRLAAQRDGDAVGIVVRDEGIGIPARDLDRIFERFYRVDRGRARDSGGTGLGLAIVRHVVSNHHGEVQVESHEGEGSTFTLRLPVGPGAVLSPRRRRTGSRRTPASATGTGPTTRAGSS